MPGWECPHRIVLWLSQSLGVNAATILIPNGGKRELGFIVSPIRRGLTGFVSYNSLPILSYGNFHLIPM